MFKQFLLIVVLTVFAIASSYSTNRPDLGSANSFAIFTGAGAFHNTGLSVITGDIGSFDEAITGFPPGIYSGTIHGPGDPAATAAKNSLNTAWTAIGLVACDETIGVTMGNGQVLFPKTYCTTAATTLSGNLTFDALGDPDAIFLVKISGALNSGELVHIILANGAKAGNIYWAVDGAVTILENSIFKGTIVANGAINISTGSRLEGRALTLAGAINFATIAAKVPVVGGGGVFPSDAIRVAGTASSTNVKDVDVDLTLRMYDAANHEIYHKDFSSINFDDQSVFSFVWDVTGVTYNPLNNVKLENQANGMILYEARLDKIVNAQSQFGAYIEPDELNMAGDFPITGDISIGGLAELLGNVFLGSDPSDLIIVDGTTTFNGPINVDGTTTFNGPITTTDDLDITGTLSLAGIEGAVGQYLMGQGAGNTPIWTSFSPVNADLTPGTGLTGGVYNGSAPITFALDLTADFAWTGTQTFTGDVTAPTFTGALAGNATTATTATNLVGSGSLTGAVDLATAEVNGILPAANLPADVVYDADLAALAALAAIDLQTAYDNGTSPTILIPNGGRGPMQIRTVDVNGGLDVFAASTSDNAIDANLVSGAAPEQAAIIGSLQAAPDEAANDYFGVLGAKNADITAGVAGFRGTTYGALGATVGGIDYAGYFAGNVNVTGDVTAPTFNGALEGNATSATTATNFAGTGSLTGAVDLATAEVNGILPAANLPTDVVYDADLADLAALAAIDLQTAYDNTPTESIPNFGNGRFIDVTGTATEDGKVLKVIRDQNVADGNNGTALAAVVNNPDAGFSSFSAAVQGMDYANTTFTPAGNEFSAIEGKLDENPASTTDGKWYGFMGIALNMDGTNLLKAGVLGTTPNRVAGALGVTLGGIDYAGYFAGDVLATGSVNGSTFHTSDNDNVNGVEIGNSNTTKAGYIDVNGSDGNQTVVLGQFDAAGTKGAVSVRSATVTKAGMYVDADDNGVVGVVDGIVQAGAMTNLGSTMLAVKNGATFEFIADELGNVYVTNNVNVKGHLYMFDSDMNPPTLSIDNAGNINTKGTFQFGVGQAVNAITLAVDASSTDAQLPTAKAVYNSFTTAMDGVTLQTAYDNGAQIVVGVNGPMQIRTDNANGGLDVFATSTSANAIDANLVIGAAPEQAAIIGSLQGAPTEVATDYFGVLGAKNADITAGVAGFRGTTIGALGATVGGTDYAGYFAGNVNVNGRQTATVTSAGTDVNGYFLQTTGTAANSQTWGAVVEAFGQGTGLAVPSVEAVLGVAKWTGGTATINDRIVGVVGKAETRATGYTGSVTAIGVAGQATDANAYPNVGVFGTAANSAYQNIGVIGLANTQVPPTLGAMTAGVLGYNANSTATDYAGYFAGNVNIDGTVSGTNNIVLDADLAAFDLQAAYNNTPTESIADFGNGRYINVTGTATEDGKVLKVIRDQNVADGTNGTALAAVVNNPDAGFSSFSAAVQGMGYTTNATFAAGEEFSAIEGKLDENPASITLGKWYGFMGIALNMDGATTPTILKAGVLGTTPNRVAGALGVTIGGAEYAGYFAGDVNINGKQTATVTSAGTDVNGYFLQTTGTADNSKTWGAVIAAYGHGTGLLTPSVEAVLGIAKWDANTTGVAGDQIVGVVGKAEAKPTGFSGNVTAIGVAGQATDVNTGLPNIGVYGFANNSTVQNFGVMGLANTSTPPSIGVMTAGVLGYNALSDATDWAGYFMGNVNVTGTLTATAFSGPLTGNVTGNASTVTNGVYTTGTYNDPTWLNTLAYSKLTGTPTGLPPTGTAGGDLSGTYPNPTVVKASNGFNVLGAGTANLLTMGSGASSEGYLKTFSPSGTSTLVTLGSTLVGERGAVSVGYGATNTPADWYASMVYMDATYGAGTPLVNSWIVGTGKITAGQGVVLQFDEANATDAKRISIFDNAFHTTFSVDKEGDVYTAGTLNVDGATTLNGDLTLVKELIMTPVGIAAVAGLSTTTATVINYSDAGTLTLTNALLPAGPEGRVMYILNNTVSPMTIIGESIPAGNIITIIYIGGTWRVLNMP